MLQKVWRGRSLAGRVVLLLSLALLPLGAIGVWQTQALSEEVARQNRAALLQATRAATQPFQSTLLRATGAAQALEPQLRRVVDDTPACIAFLRAFQQETRYSYVAFVPPDGRMECSSDGRSFDFSDFPSFAESLRVRAPSITRNPNAPMSATAVLIVTEVVRDEAGDLMGFLSLSLPEVELPEPAVVDDGERPIGLVTFNARGDVLTSNLPEAELPGSLPTGRDLLALREGGNRAFDARDRDGVDRIYAIVPIVPGQAYALSSWERGLVSDSWLDDVVLEALVPVLMWLASLLVAVLALERLLFRHVRTLGRQMRAFARSRRMVRQPMLAEAGAEIAQIEADFRNMAQAILQDEAQLENNLREKNVLLKEVHHRVKNNLQLVSSIMNMQARRLRSPEARAVLRRVQDRVMGLAAVHRSLYQTEDMAHVDVGAMVADLARQIASADGDGRAVDVRVRAEPLVMDADRAVALSLAVSEAMTNAVFHVSRPEMDGSPAWVRLSLERLDGDRARLVVANPRRVNRTVPPTPLEGAGGGVATAARPADDPETTAVHATSGLGQQLLRAFATQLGGTLSHHETDDTFEVTLAFPVEAHRAAPRDY